MSSKSKRNRNDKNKPSNASQRDRSGLLTPSDRSRLLTPASRRVLAGDINLIVGNHEQFHGPALIKLGPAVSG